MNSQSSLQTFTDNNPITNSKRYSSEITNIFNTAHEGYINNSGKDSDGLLFNERVLEETSSLATSSVDEFNEDEVPIFQEFKLELNSRKKFTISGEIEAEVFSSGFFFGFTLPFQTKSLSSKCLRNPSNLPLDSDCSCDDKSNCSIVSNKTFSSQTAIFFAQFEVPEDTIFSLSVVRFSFRSGSSYVSDFGQLKNDKVISKCLEFTYDNYFEMSCKGCASHYKLNYIGLCELFDGNPLTYSNSKRIDDVISLSLLLSIAIGTLISYQNVFLLKSRNGSIVFATFFGIGQMLIVSLCMAKQIYLYNWISGGIYISLLIFNFWIGNFLALSNLFDQKTPRMKGFYSMAISSLLVVIGPASVYFIQITLTKQYFFIKRNVKFIVVSLQIVLGCSSLILLYTSDLYANTQRTSVFIIHILAVSFSFSLAITNDKTSNNILEGLKAKNTNNIADFREDIKPGWNTDITKTHIDNSADKLSHFFDSVDDSERTRSDKSS